MRTKGVILGLLLALPAACEDPTLYVGGGLEESALEDAGRRTQRPAPIVDAGEDEAALEPAEQEPPEPEPPTTEPPITEPASPTQDVPAAVLDAGPPNIGTLPDGGGPPIGVTGINLDWSTWPPRIRFQVSCRRDFECAVVRQGVCVESRCVQCRDSRDCAQPATCSSEHICIPTQ
jgi:hypothetical protein